MVESTTVSKQGVDLSDFVMPKTAMPVSMEWVAVIVAVPVIMQDGQPEPDAKDKNGIRVIINPDFRRIWMKYYYPHLKNYPGSGWWTCYNCSSKGDRFWMKAHVDLGVCERNKLKEKKGKNDDNDD